MKLSTPNGDGTLLPTTTPVKQKNAARGGALSYSVANARVRHGLYLMAVYFASDAHDQNTRKAAAKFVRRLGQKGGRL